jgi:TRAP-type mannitol/chloroaromatic compound transport system permease small subunit
LLGKIAVGEGFFRELADGRRITQWFWAPISGSRKEQGVGVERIVQIVDQVSVALARLSKWIIVLMMLVTSFEVVMRYIVKKPTIWAWDLNIQLFAAAIMLGGAYTLREDAHVRMDVLVSSLSPRARAWLDVWTFALFAMGVIILTWGGWEMAWMSIKARERMPTVWAPPYYFMKMLVPLGGVLVMVQGVADVLKKLKFLMAR